MKIYRSGKISQLGNSHVTLSSTFFFFMFTLHLFERIQSLMLGVLYSNNNLMLEET